MALDLTSRSFLIPGHFKEHVFTYSVFTYSILAKPEQQALTSNPHLTEGEAEALSSKVTCLGSHCQEVPGQDWNPESTPCSMAPSSKGCIV